ncbi:MAG: hypothetical protein ACI9W6_001671, partial [Motiliproteus sp.]
MPLLSGTDNGPRPRHTVHPVHRRSCASLRPRHTVHPVHKKAPVIADGGFDQTVLDLRGLGSRRSLNGILSLA